MLRTLVVPAAGPGSRLKSAVPKALTPVNGRPMIDHLLDRYAPFVSSAIVIAHPSFAPDVRARLQGAGNGLPTEVIEQRQTTGMLDAILLALPAVRDGSAESVWVTWCDQIGILPATLERVAREDVARPAPDLVLPTVHGAEPYTHLERDPGGRIVRALHRREGDTMPDRGEADMGVFAFARAAFLEDLPAFVRDAPLGAATGERNFLPVIPWLAARGRVVTFACTDPMEARGVNTPEDLRQVEAWLRERF